MNKSEMDSRETPASKIKRRGSDTGDTDTHALCLIVPTLKVCSVSDTPIGKWLITGSCDRNWRRELQFRFCGEWSDFLPLVTSSAGMNRGRGKGYPRENPPTSGIVRHDSHVRKSGSDPRRESNPVRHCGRQGRRCFAGLLVIGRGPRRISGRGFTALALCVCRRAEDLFPNAPPGTVLREPSCRYITRPAQRWNDRQLTWTDVTAPPCWRSLPLESTCKNLPDNSYLSVP
ncbi:hypothetical protein PR048_023323 [Dryococelus australis]|uniref:Uncharacterized protein n=1 Tax=Dryococelus australis TaxID=614101 RepID=A0ABQ9GTR6_9NEOP|nr:hypothetical protein PR048_023323 [Dryococelus australis]